MFNKLRSLAFLSLVSLFLFSAGGVAYSAESEPSLEMNVGAQTQHLTRAELLKHPALRTIEIPSDVAYKRSMRYQAIPLSALISTLSQTETVQFTALDGFVANIPSKLLTSEGQPWLAIENTKTPWPALKARGPSAGPFYLVWLTPERANISPEQWPYQIKKIAAASSLEKRYPQILPKANASSAVQRGLHVYIANCAVCHRINGGGDAAVGPDLNKPYSPTEYFQAPFLTKLIRDPASVRDWGQRTMPGFSPSVLSDEKLDDLLAYLRHMAKQRSRNPQR